MSDDILYIITLLFSLFLGYLLHKITDVTLKKWTSTILGLSIALALSGLHVLHHLISVAFVIGLLQFYPKHKCHGISFLCLFFYLLFFRLCHYVGLPSPPAQANIIQMMLTLKLVGICCEISSVWQKKQALKKTEDEKQENDLKLQLKYEAVDPSAIDVIHYSFCCIGLVTGPYYKYRVYEDFLTNSTAPDKRIAYCFEAFKKRISILPLYAVLFLLSSYIWPLSFAKSQEIFVEYSILYRIWYMTPIFFTYRMRMYSAFLLSECICILAGLGAYPKVAESLPGKGPSNYEALENNKNDENLSYDFETIHNIDEYEADFSPTVRGGMRAWNRTVQYWLVVNVYKQLKLAKPVKEALTMLTSAFWHGIHSGYYLSMLTVPFIIAVEDYYDRLIRRRLSEQNQKVYDFLSWFLKMQHFAYMGTAFLLLHVNDTVYYWLSIGFIHHGVIAFMHGVAQFVNLIAGKAEKKLKKARETTRIGDARIRVLRSENNTNEDKKNI